MRSIARAVCCTILLIISGCLLWYSACTFRVAVKDLDFTGSTSSVFFPEAVLIGGKLKYYSSLDPRAACESFKKAIVAEPSLLDAWLALARAEVAMGNRGEAERVLAIIAPTLLSISSWKWEELLLAYDLRDEKYFRHCFNFILSYLPHRIREASWLGARFWGGWENVLPHLSGNNHSAFLAQVMAAREPDAALALWKTMEEESAGISEKEILKFCQFLISSDRLDEAKKIWKLWKRDDDSNVSDGGFEFQPLNTAFGWRFSDNPDVIVERTTDQPYAGNACLHLHFKGSANVRFGDVAQIIPVRPDTGYLLRFALKSRNLTTDRGIFVEIGGYGCEEFTVAGRPVLGSGPWTEDELEFVTPAGCEAVLLRVCRKESLKFDNRISGDYWLDAVELKEK